MSRDYTPTYRVEYVMNIGNATMAWQTHYGRPDKDGLENWRQKYNESFLPGGVNEPSDKTSIVPHIQSAKLIRQSTGEVVAECYAPMFEVM